MKAKEYLQSIEIMQTKIEQKQQRAKEYRELALAIGGFDYSKERVQTSNLGGQIESPVVRYLELEAEINENIKILQAEKDRITDEIHNLSNPKYVKILFKRYVEGKNLGQVAKEIDFTYQYVRSLHGEALKEFEKINLPTKSYKKM